MSKQADSHVYALPSFSLHCRMNKAWVKSIPVTLKERDSSTPILGNEGGSCDLFGLPSTR